MSQPCPGRVSAGGAPDLLSGAATGQVAPFSLTDPRSATVEALCDVRLLVLPRDDLEDLMRDRPEVPIAILKVLVRRLRAANAGAPTSSVARGP